MIRSADTPISSFFAYGPPSGWQILFAVLVIVAGWILSIFARRGVLAVAKRWPGVSAQLGMLVARIVKYGIILLAVGVALSFLGAPIQPILAAAIIVAVGAVLALRGVADNFAAGIIIQSRHPIKVGDEIETLDIAGTVSDINARSVVVHTHDGRTVHIPNSSVLSRPLQNNSAAHALRSELEVRCFGSGAGSTATRDTIVAAAARADGVHERPRPSALLVATSGDRAIYRVRLWHHPQHGSVVLDAATRSIAEEFSGHALQTSVEWPAPPRPLTPPFEV